MAATWRILISRPMGATGASTAVVASVIRAEVEEIRAALEDRAMGMVRLERLVSPLLHPASLDPSDSTTTPTDGDSQWLVTVEAQTHSDHAIEQFLVLHSIERLQQQLGNDVHVDLTRSAESNLHPVGDVAGGYRIVVSVDPDAPIGELRRVRADVLAVARILSEPVEIRKLGWVRLVWYPLPPDEADRRFDPDGRQPTTPITVAEIVIDQDAEQLSVHEPLDGFLSGLCHAVAVPWNDDPDSLVSVAVQRFTVEPPNRHAQDFFGGLEQPWASHGAGRGYTR
ncbi:MAG: hypothetical protein ACKOYG_08035 [Ilumatobacteraceae bacterium]